MSCLPSFASIPQLRAGLYLAAVALSASVGHAQYVMVDDFAKGPAKHIENSVGKTFEATNKILIPTLYLRVTTDGSVFASKRAGSSTASAKGKFVSEGFDKATLMSLAKKLQDEFVARLRADGWEVLTYDDVKNDPGVASMERNAGEAPLGLPQDSAGQFNYASATPTDEQNFKPAMQGTHWTFRHVAKAMNATVVIPQIDVLVPQIWAETRKGYKSATAEIKTAPGLNLNMAMILALNPKGGGGAVFKLKYAMVDGATVGAFIDAKDKSPTAGNAISKGLSILGGGGNINRASASYVFAVTPAVFAERTVTDGKLFLNEVARTIAPQRK